ncbi:hypothetical protein Q9L58_008337 [Maublancomyces gigas]|uniref:Uncharacterized protein n=1 Tax=Discina gigas TaxID=1032678 RepID=A0ABR3GAR7_9PEZI
MAAAPPTKRAKSRKLIDPIAVLAGLEQQSQTPAEALDWVKKVLRTAINMDPQSPPSPSEKQKQKQKVLSSSTIDMTDVRNLLDVYHSDLDLDCEWKVAETETTATMGTTWAETAINELRSDKDWGIETCEALTRTIVDLLIFDRKRLLSTACRFQSLRLVGEYPITTQTCEDDTIISGRCDLVLGYGGHSGKKDLDFGLVAVEIKRRYALPTTVSAQLVAYLVGLQQRRHDANKIVKHVFGIATDGMNYIFHRLDSNLNLRTATVTAAHKAHICRYIDVIMESAVRASPHTSPSTRFPGSAAQYENGVEKHLWTNPIQMARMIVDAEPFDYIVVVGEDGEPMFQVVEGESEEEDEE